MAKTDGAQRPTITLPPRSSIETLFTGLSPGPLTLVSNFFSDNDNYPDSDCRSFSQLLAGAMASPVAGAGTPKLPNFLPDSSAKEGGNSGNGTGEEKLGFKQNRPVNLVVGNSSSTHPPPVFMIPPGLSPSGFLNSPGFFSPLQVSCRVIFFTVFFFFFSVSVFDLQRILIKQNIKFYHFLYPLNLIISWNAKLVVKVLILVRNIRGLFFWINVWPVYTHLN